jgi:MOSC domain-containing protein
MSYTAQTELGSVVSLWRYPVKSMMGEELNATEVTERGLLGDRAYALVDKSSPSVIVRRAFYRRTMTMG